MNKIVISIISLAFFYVLSTTVGGAMGQKPNYKDGIKAKLKKIDISDGVSKEEAIIIAQNDLISNKGDKDCIVSKAKVIDENEPFWNKDYWHISFNTKPMFRIKTGLEWITVNVHKKTGKITPGGGGPS